MGAPRSPPPHAPRPAASLPTARPAPDLVTRMKVLAHDMERARQSVASGTIPPQHYALLARLLEGRLDSIEAEVFHKVRREN